MGSAFLVILAGTAYFLVLFIGWLIDCCDRGILHIRILIAASRLKRAQDQLAKIQHAQKSFALTPYIKPKKVSVIKHRASRGDDVVNWVTPVTTVRLYS